MDISVIIPSYKPQEYIEECLRSLDAQTLDKSRYEVLIILNGEKEPYYSKIERILDFCTFNCNLLHTDVAGVSNARNRGLDNAAGDYICFIDDDDYVSPDYLSELLSKASSDTISLCYPYAFSDGNATQIAYSITEVYNSRAAAGRQRFSSKVRRYFNGPCMKLIPMSFIQDRRFDTRFANGEDGLFMFLISDKFRFVDFTSGRAVYYRRYRDNSAVTSKKALHYIFKNTLQLSAAYSSIFFRHPLDYRFTFFINRLMANFNSMIYKLKHNN